MMQMQMPIRVGRATQCLQPSEASGCSTQQLEFRPLVRRLSPLQADEAAEVHGDGSGFANPRLQSDEGHPKILSYLQETFTSSKQKPATQGYHNTQDTIGAPNYVCELESLDCRESTVDLLHDTLV